MERVRRLAPFWSWLPAFRAVAESQHLPSAARAIGIAPSGLSRAVRLLEAALGQQLFRRSGRRLELSPQGEGFLSAVREAMRAIDEGLLLLGAVDTTGPLQVAVAGSLVQLIVLPALDRVRHDHPGMAVRLHRLLDSSTAALRDGTLDLVVSHRHVAHRDLVAELVGQVPYGIFCGRGHLLRHARAVSAARLSAHAFVVCEAGDPWPSHVPRRIGLQVTEFSDAVAACAQGDHLAVLPLGLERSRGLRRLPSRIPSAQPLFAITRRPLPGPTAQLLGAVLAELRSGLRRSAR